MPHFMIVLITYINLLNLSWIIKCLFLRNLEPLTFLCTTVITFSVRLTTSLMTRLKIMVLIWRILVLATQLVFLQVSTLLPLSCGRQN